MLPLIAHNLTQSIQILTNGTKMFTEKLIQDLKANEKICSDYIEGSLAMCTSLAPLIGYDKAAIVAKKAHKDNTSLKDAIIELGYMSGDDFDRLVQPQQMISPREKK